MQMSLKEGEAYAALREAVASQIQEMKAALLNFNAFYIILHLKSALPKLTMPAHYHGALAPVYHLFNSLVESLDVELVDNLSFPVKVCLESQEARERERQWLKHQTTGELDENRLVVTLHNFSEN